MGASALQLKCFENSCELEMVPMTLNLDGLWGSVMTPSCELSGVLTEHHTCRNDKETQNSFFTRSFKIICWFLWRKRDFWRNKLVITYYDFSYASASALLSVFWGYSFEMSCPDSYVWACFVLIFNLKPSSSQKYVFLLNIWLFAHTMHHSAQWNSVWH